MKNPVQLHGPFIIETIFSSCAIQALKTGRNIDEVALATFLALGGFLKARGHSIDSLQKSLIVTATPPHEAPEALQ